EVLLAGGFLALGGKIRAEPQGTLRGDRGGGAVDRLVCVERSRVLLRVVAELVAVERHAVPIRDAILRGIAVDVVVARGACGFEEQIRDRATPTDGVEIAAFHRIQKFELFRITADDPGGAARPRRERRVTLLRAQA